GTRMVRTSWPRAEAMDSKMIGQRSFVAHFRRAGFMWRNCPKAVGISQASIGRRWTSPVGDLIDFLVFEACKSWICVFFIGFGVTKGYCRNLPRFLRNKA